MKRLVPILGIPINRDWKQRLPNNKTHHQIFDSSGGARCPAYGVGGKWTKGECHAKSRLTTASLELIKQLSTENLKAAIDYLNYLQDKEAWAATHGLTGHAEIAKSLEAEPTGKNPIAQHIIEAVEKSHDVTLEDVEFLLQVIKENRR